MFVSISCRAELLEVEDDVVASTVLRVDNHVRRNILGQQLFQIPDTVDCSIESVNTSFEDDLRALKMTSDHIGHRLVDVHEGFSRDTCCGFYIVAVQINRFILVCFVDLCVYEIHSSSF
jgi:hypothetical protein